MSGFDLAALQAELRDFAAARQWEVFHTPKNLAMALIGEAAEVVELFQWVTPEESVSLVATAHGRAALADELADVMIYLARLADLTGIDLGAAVADKQRRNVLRFPPSRA